MAVLARQNLVIPLGGGLDTELADKLLPLGKLLGLENGVFNQTGRISKRPGNATLASPPGTSFQLATSRGALIDLTTNPAGPIGVYTAGGARWASSTIGGSLRGPVNTDRLSVYSGAGQKPQSGDVAYNAAAGVYVSAFDTLDTAGTYTRRVVVQDATGQVVYQSSATSATPTDPRVLSVSSSVCVAYHDNAGHVVVDVFTGTALQNGTAPVTWTVTAIANAQPYIDLAVGAIAGTLEIAYRSNAATTRRNTLTIVTGVSVDQQITTAAAGAINPTLALVWIQDLGSSGRIGIATAGPAGVQVQWNLTGGTPAATFVLDAGATANVNGLTCHTISSNSLGEVVCVWDVYNATSTLSVSRFGKRTVAGGVIAPVNFILGMVLESKVFSVNGDVYVLVGYISTVQPTVFMVRVSPTHDVTPVRAPLARMLVTKAQAGLARGSMLSSVPTGPLATRVAALRKQTRLNVVTGVAFIDIGLDLVTLTFAGAMSRAADTGDTLFAPGGNLNVFDGASFTDHGHPLYPEGVSVGTQAAGGNLNIGTYTWVWVYRYTDNNGRVVRSQPSPPASFPITVNGSHVTVTGPYARMHGRPAASDVVVEQYRTTLNGSLYFLETTFANDPTLSTVGVNSSLDDVNLQTQEPLYTTGGAALANVPISGTRALTVFRDRVWFISADDPNEVWPSTLNDAAVGFGWSDQIIIRKQDAGGGFTAIAGMGLNTYLFKATAIYAVNGAGPNGAGQGDFGEPQEVVAGNGTTEPRSVVVTPVGIFFKGPKGFWLLNGGTPTYVGAPVTAFNGLSVLASEVFPTLNQVRFYCTGTKVLVYDYLHQQWIVWTTPLVFAGATNWAGTPAIVSIGGSGVGVELDGLYQDFGFDYGVKIATPWISAGGLQGVERVYEIQGVGDCHGDHTLQVTVQYDNDKGPTQVYTKAFLAGDDWQWRLKLARQTATAIKVTLEEIFPTSPASAAFSAVALVLNVGVEPSHLKRFLASAKSLLRTA